MSSMRVPVVSLGGKPLSPTTPAKARKLLRGTPDIFDMPFPQRSRPRPLCLSRLGRFDGSSYNASPRGLPSSRT